MTQFDKIMRQALLLWPNAIVDQDNDGQYIVYTDIYAAPKPDDSDDE